MMYVYFVHEGRLCRYEINVSQNIGILLMALLETEHNFIISDQSMTVTQLGALLSNVPLDQPITII